MFYILIKPFNNVDFENTVTEIIYVLLKIVRDVISNVFTSP